MTTAVFESPLGFVRILGDEHGVSAITCMDDLTAEPEWGCLPDNSPVEPVRLAVQQLNEYFAGTRQAFDFAISPVGTPFQQTVWRALSEVPFGTTASYLNLTRRIGSERAIRAVAAANGRNPLWIVVPCHRIIGSDGSLTGYAGGLWRKRWLLNHERPEYGQIDAGQKTGQQLSLF